MSPLLKDGDELKFVRKNPIEVLRNDLVILKLSSQKRPLVKRVYGVPGDRFSIKAENDLCFPHIESKALHNSAGVRFSFRGKQCKMLKLYENDYKGKIPMRTYLVLGDTPEGSRDATTFGMIGISQIVGTVKKISTKK